MDVKEINVEHLVKILGPYRMPNDKDQRQAVVESVASALPPDNQEYAWMELSGRPWHEIADALGVCASTVYRLRADLVKVILAHPDLLNHLVDLQAVKVPFKTWTVQQAMEFWNLKPDTLQERAKSLDLNVIREPLLADFLLLGGAERLYAYVERLQEARGRFGPRLLEFAEAFCDNPDVVGIMGVSRQRVGQFKARLFELIQFNEPDAKRLSRVIPPHCMEALRGPVCGIGANWNQFGLLLNEYARLKWDLWAAITGEQDD